MGSSGMLTLRDSSCSSWRLSMLGCKPHNLVSDPSELQRIHSSRLVLVKTMATCCCPRWSLHTSDCTGIAPDMI